MQKSLILWLTVILLVVIFAVLNAAPVAVNLIVTSFQLSLAVLIVFPLVLGVTAGVMLGFVARRRLSKQVKELSNSLSAAQAEVEGLRSQIESAARQAAAVSAASAVDAGTAGSDAAALSAPGSSPQVESLSTMTGTAIPADAAPSAEEKPLRAGLFGRRRR